MNNLNTINGYYLDDNLTTLHKLITKYVIDDLEKKCQLGIGDIIQTTVNNLSSEIYADVIKFLPDSEIKRIKEKKWDWERNTGNYYYYKVSNYNLLLLSKKWKIKIFLGLNAPVAKENYNLAKNIFKNYNYLTCDFIEIDRPNYRIEIVRIVPGISVGELFYKGYYDDNNKKILDYMLSNDNPLNICTNLFFKFIIDVYYSENEKHIYPNDNNIDNFIITENILDYYESDGSNATSAFINIDWDHLNISDDDNMIHNVAWQFFGRMYDKTLYSDETVQPWIKEWRNECDLYQRVKTFKDKFYRLVGKEHMIGITDDDFVNPVFLNSSKYLINLVDELQKEKTK